MRGYRPNEKEIVNDILSNFGEFSYNQDLKNYAKKTLHQIRLCTFAGCERPSDEKARSRFCKKHRIQHWKPFTEPFFDHKDVCPICRPLVLQCRDDDSSGLCPDGRRLRLEMHHEVDNLEQKVGRTR